MNLASSEPKNKEAKSPLELWVEYQATMACEELVALSAAKKDEIRPRIVIAFDEAHTLCESMSDKSGTQWSPSHVLCRLISSFSGQLPLWVIFITTNPRLGHFSPPNTFRRSNEEDTTNDADDARIQTGPTE